MLKNGFYTLKIWVSTCGSPPISLKFIEIVGKNTFLGQLFDRGVQAARVPPQRSIDETSLSNGELYTILTNKAAKGGKGSIVAVVAGPKAEEVIQVLRKMPERQRKKVREVTLNMAGSLGQIVKRCFPQAVRVIGRFHVQRLAMDALQELRIQHRQQAIEQAKVTQVDYEPEVLPNGDTVKQLLARSRYVLNNKASDWTEIQKQRAKLLFERYADLKKAYEMSALIT